MKINDDKITPSNIIEAVEMEIFGRDIPETEIELSRELFDTLYAKLVFKRVMTWTGQHKRSEITQFYYPFSDCNITVIE